MRIRTSIYILSLLYFQTLALATSVTDYAFLNTSNLVFLNADNDPHPQQHQFPHFLEEILKKISVAQRWKLEDIRVSNLDLRKARFGKSKRYEVRLRFGKKDLIFGVSDDVISWMKKKNGGNDFESLVDRVRSISVLDSIKVEGPFELRVDAPNELSLLLPMNSTHTGLNRVLVGEGITVEIKGAREISLFCSSTLDLPVNQSIPLKKNKPEFWPLLGQTSSAPLLPIHILGSSSLIAYKTQNPNAYIETKFLSKDIIELLPEKCYNRYTNKKRACPIETLNLKVALLEKVLKSFLGGRYHQTRSRGFVKAKIKASTVVRFKFELETRIGRNKSEAVMAEWKTKPTVERNWFEVTSRLEGDKLKPVLIKKVGSFIVKDTISWSNLMSNISFTKFPSLLVRSEALTLDVKW